VTTPRGYGPNLFRAALLAIANWQLFEQQNVVGRKKKFPFQKPPCHAMATLHVGPWYVNRIYPDAAMGIAYASTLEEGETLATLELKINFLKHIGKRNCVL
jgi:hypothetical protein